jgi:hypothetical protein
MQSLIYVQAGLFCPSEADDVANILHACVALNEIT